MNLETLVFLLVLAVLIICMVAEWFRPAFAFFGAIVFLLIFGIITPEVAMSGFSNPQLAIIVLLLIVSDIFRKTAITDNILGLLFRKSSNVKVFYFKMITSVSFFSAWFNNTPLVAVYLPYVHDWAKSNGIAPSKLLIPLSYASILGGAVTLIGTSTNLIVNGLLYDAGLPMFGFFEFALVGGAMLLFGSMYLIFIAPKLLPDYQTLASSFKEHSRDFFIETIVKSGSPIINKNIGNAGLRNLEGLFLVEIIRNHKAISPVEPSEVLCEDDVLIFTGDKSKIQELIHPSMGLSLPKECDFQWEERFDLIEAVVAPNASIVGKTVKNIGFRGTYDGAILAIHRNGERTKGKIGDHTIRVGDVLLVIAGNDFVNRSKKENSFYLLSKQKEQTKPSGTKISILGIGFALSIVLTFFNISLFQSLSVLIIASFFFGLLDFKSLPKVLDFDLIFVIAFGLALGKGFTSLGVTEQLSNFIHQFESIPHPILIIGSIFLITNLFASFVTSKAAVAIVFPISITIAQAFGLPIMPIVLSMTFGAVANFITPIGYQTNMMVYGPGSYKFLDYFKVGLPLVTLYWIVSSVILYFIYF